MNLAASPAHHSRILARTLAVGLGLAVAVAIGGRVVERWRFGPTDQDTYRRVEREFRERVAESSDALGRLAANVAAAPELIRHPTTARQLFERLDGAIAAEHTAGTGLTVFDPAGQPIAWSGRVSDINQERIDGAAVVFMARGAFGPFLVRVEPVPDPAHPATRLGTIVAEQLLGEAQGAPGADQFVFLGSLAPVILRTSVTAGSSSREYSFVVPSASGQLLVEAHVDARALAAAREGWRARVRSTALLIAALTLLVCAMPLLGSWRAARSARTLMATAAGLTAVAAGARLLLHWAAASWLAPPLRESLAFLLNSLLMAAAALFAFALIERWRVAGRRRLLAAGSVATVRTATLYGLAGLIDVALLWNYGRLLQGVAINASTDILRFSLHPAAIDRLALAFGLLLLHATVVWAGALVIRGAGLATRTIPGTSRNMTVVGAWVLGVSAGLAVAARTTASASTGLNAPLQPMPIPAIVFALAGVVLCALALSRPRGTVRRMSQAARFFAAYLALLVPALALYPALHAVAGHAKESLVAGTFGPQALNIREDLQAQLQDAERSIDTRPGLELLLERAPGTQTPTTDQAFVVWSDTVLATQRLTSAVELYDQSGTLLSRFALNLPEYQTSSPSGGPCSSPTDPPVWDVIEEVSNVLRASRTVCTASGSAGVVVVRVMLDYRTLPFISSGRPYLESLETAPIASREDAPGRDVEFAVYGWSRSPIYMEGTTVWPLPDSVFQQMTASRAPFWATVQRSSENFRVYFLSDRKGIYALGYPVLTPTDHLINLAELVVLTGVLYVGLLAAGRASRALTSSASASGRTLLREVRSSFYRKLFLAFVAVAIIPATILAVATRNRLARQFNDSVTEAAIKTATVAQRLVEDYATIQQQQRGTDALDGLDDQVMMLVERAIAQDVNLFNRATLQATSERELFASRLFPTRAPADVYRGIVLDRMLTFAAVEDAGGFSYLLAAAPVRASDSDQIRIVTVPLTLRQRDLDRQRDDLDRRVWSYFVLFVLLGAGLGYWMAERIADPVNRLTRATRRIARGDLDARIAATSSDELRRLVEDFNSMADDLKRQRTELERTQRLEAWADMARQVAHDVKNPLTPIQLSAEHALRVNADRGRPLSPVLEECVTSILSQVKLLRQISAEFSSFASSPTARLEATGLPELIEEVVEPYRNGLAGRIELVTRSAGLLPLARVDKTLFARALTNVMENALHAMPGRGRLEIHVTEAPDSQQPPSLAVTVTDTGVGMDPEALGRIFEPYFSTKATGTGLGLTIAKRNIELVGGTIAVQSQRGTGTVITMTVPTVPT